jgi:hypothetical protein
MSNGSERTAVVIRGAPGIGWAQLKSCLDVMSHVMKLLESQ